MSITVVRLLPCIMIALQAVSGLVYFAHGDWRQGTYWLAAAVLTVAVTF